MLSKDAQKWYWVNLEKIQTQRTLREKSLDTMQLGRGVL
jgi:hypothetical protein